MRYETRTTRSIFREFWDDEAPDESRNGSIEVVCSDRETFTGLLSAEGLPLHKKNDPIGFDLGGTK